MFNDAKDGGHNYEKKNLGCGTDVVDDTGGVMEIDYFVRFSDDTYDDDSENDDNDDYNYDNYNVQAIHTNLYASSWFLTMFMMIIMMMKMMMRTMINMTITMFRQSTRIFTPAAGFSPFSPPLSLFPYLAGS